MANTAYEQIIYTAKPHWIYLAPPAVVVALGLCCGGCTLLTSLAEPAPGQPPVPDETIYTMVSCSLCIFAVALVWVVTATLAWINASYIVTDRRVILEGGILSKHTKEIFRQKIESVEIVTPVLGRVFGYATVLVRSGLATQQLRGVSAPEELRRQIVGQATR